jgi:hypothetical protein
MDDELLSEATGSEAERESLSDELRGLAEDARAFARAELAYQKSRASYAGKQTAIIAGCVGAALVFLFFAVEALVFGAILALTPGLGAIGATAAVVGSLLLAALLVVAVARLRWNRMKAKIAQQDD